MKRWWLVPAGLGVAGALAITLLVRDNLRLRADLGSTRAALAAARAGSISAAPSAGAPASDGAARPSRGNPMNLIGTLGRAVSERGSAESGPGSDAGPVDWEARRAERQQRMRDLLGRRPGESEEAYRARVAPMVETVLGIPRNRAAERRRQFEEAAGVNAEQKARLDTAFQEASAEVIGLANAAIANGDLTPYQRNSRGVLAFVGSTVGTVDALDQQLRKILSPEQLGVMEEAGFDPLEYLGITSPWETLHPPPPAPGTGM